MIIRKIPIILACACIFSFTAYSQPVYNPTINEDNLVINNKDILKNLDINSVKKLSLKKMKLSRFPKVILRIKNLEVLDLSGNNIRTIPDEIGNLSNLKHLNLSANQLTELPNSLKNLTNLTYLDISYNQLQKFPEILELPNLQYLNISGNLFTRLPSNIDNLSSLQSFYAAHNNLTLLPASLGNLKNLTDLWLHNNKLTQLPNEIGNLTQINRIILYNNNLMELPNSINQLSKLTYFDISKNEFIKISNEIKEMQNLKTLFVKRKDDQIPEIPDPVLTLIRDKQVITDIGDLSNRLIELGKRELEERKRKDAEVELANAKARDEENKRRLADARSENDKKEREKAELAQKAQAARDAAERQRLETEREIAEKEKEIAEIEKKKQAETDAAKRLQLERDSKAREKELAALKETKKLQEKASREEKLRIEKEKLFQNTINIFAFIGLGLASLFILFMLRTNRKVKQKQKEAELQRQKADKLLLNILPLEVAEELKEKGITEVKFFTNTSVMFADVKGFSALASKVTPQALIKELDTTFGRFDDIIQQYRLERIKTIGDCYMCVGGVPTPDPANIVYMVAAALEIQNWMNSELEARNGDFWRVRLGIHIGELVAGVIGKTKFAYDVWGHAVNTASRMESGGEVSRVNISVDTYEAIKDFFECEYRGKIEAKNIGLVDTYFVNSIKKELSLEGKGMLPNDSFFQQVKKTYGVEYIKPVQIESIKS